MLFIDFIKKKLQTIDCQLVFLLLHDKNNSNETVNYSPTTFHIYNK